MTESDSEDFEECLKKIESKYSSDFDELPTNNFVQQLHILSQEFDTMGLSTLDIKQSLPKTVDQIVSNTFQIIQIHRKTLSGCTDLGVTCQYKDSRNRDLEKTIASLKLKLQLVEDQKDQLENKFDNLLDENTKLKKLTSLHNKETEKIKLYCKSKQNELNHLVKKLENENNHLRGMCSLDVDKYYSKEEKFLKVLKKYKQNEEIYKSTLQKLEQNNADIMEEILNLKTELALAYSKT